MIAVITGDIIDSRSLGSQQEWLIPIQSLFSKWGKVSKAWEIFRGDSFQLEVLDPMEALQKAFMIKATIKSITGDQLQKRTGPVDVRMSIGIGEKLNDNTPIGMRTGSAYYHSGEAFELLRKQEQNLLIKTDWEDFDREMNLMFKLALILMDNWTVSAAEIVEIALENPNLKQIEIASMLELEQQSVSGRFKRAYFEELMELDNVYKLKLKKLLP
ncbi:SatD family protein [Aquiflexum lacus]|uniref:SatD family protein n=1 Tax=Aquiflexum lacus TaxID=2483805 RepID=UPI0018952913|nr:SatD family protein [Aquiflexum lacus]